jgi:hypothetical protein
VLFDETMDLSRIEQMSLSVRYIHNKSLKEDFIGFVDVMKHYYDDLNTEPNEPKLSDQVVGKMVIDFLKSNSFDLDVLVGIGSDGADGSDVLMTSNLF